MAKVSEPPPDALLEARRLLAAVAALHIASRPPLRCVECSKRWPCPSYSLALAVAQPHESVAG